MPAPRRPPQTPVVGDDLPGVRERRTVNIDVLDCGCVVESDDDTLVQSVTCCSDAHAAVIEVLNLAAALRLLTDPHWTAR